MGLLKKKRICVWCQKSPKELHYLGGWGDHNVPQIKRLQIKRLRIPKRIVCPDCKKKFKPRIKECHDINCWHVYIPAHKKWSKQ